MSVFVFVFCSLRLCTIQGNILIVDWLVHHRWSNVDYHWWELYANRKSSIWHWYLNIHKVGVIFCIYIVLYIHFLVLSVVFFIYNKITIGVIYIAPKKINSLWRFTIRFLSKKKRSAQLKYLPNKNVFILFLKSDSEGEFLMWSVKLFQICGAENEKLLLPIFWELIFLFF